MSGLIRLRCIQQNLNSNGVALLWHFRPIVGGGQLPQCIMWLRGAGEARDGPDNQTHKRPVGIDDGDAQGVVDVRGFTHDINW
jgi:hypothetical protein